MSKPRVLLIALFAFSPTFFVIPMYPQSSVQFTQIVNRAPVNLTLVIAPQAVGVGQPITMSSTIAGKPGYPPTGTILFAATPTSGTPQTFTFALPAGGNTASWSVVLPAGVFEATASYSGDLSYLPELVTASSPIAIAPPDFSLSAPSIQDVVQGLTGTVTLYITPINGWRGTISFKCSNSDSGVGCKLPQSSVTMASGAATPGTLTVLIDTFPTSVGVIGGFALLLFANLGVSRRPSRLLRKLIAVSAVVSMTGCGVSHYVQHDGTPLGVHSVVITGISGAITHSQTITIRVVKHS